MQLEHYSLQYIIYKKTCPSLYKSVIFYIKFKMNEKVHSIFKTFYMTCKQTYFFWNMETGGK